MGFGKSHGFYKPKAGGKDTKDPSFHKQRYIIPRDNQTRKKVSHHHTPRSPQKRARIEAAEEVVGTFTQIEAADEVVLPHIDVSPADAEQVAEELHTPHYVPPVAVRPQRLCLKRRISENIKIIPSASDFSLC